MDIEIISENVFYDMIDLNLYSTRDEEPYVSSIKNLLNELIKQYELPDKSLYLDSNLSKKRDNSGQETSKSICIFEPEYPPRSKAKETLGRNFVVMNLKPASSGLLELLIRDLQFNSVPLPESATVKIIKSDKVFHHVLFDVNSSDFLEYIRNNVIFALANYKSSSSFGCCSHFIQCSDEKRCVHENKLYSKGCKYRTHLEAGKIFYGKNANI